MSSRKAEHSPAVLAEKAHALVQVNPRQALALAERAFETASSERDAKAQIAALYALGWARNVLGDTRGARTALRAGIRIGERSGDRRGVGLLRRLLAFSYSIAGERRAAEREIDTALGLLSGVDRARSQVHRVAIVRGAASADPDVYRRLVADTARALRLLRREGDTIWEARLQFNRGLLHFDRGEFDQAEADLRRAQDLYTRVGAQAAAVDAIEILAEIALLRGDLLGALATLDRASGVLVPGQLDVNYYDARARALVQARLLPDAREALTRYAEMCTKAGLRDLAATALLDQAALALLSHDPAAARYFAGKAVRSFTRRRQSANAADARILVLRARLQEGTVRGSDVRDGIASAEVLERAGRRLQALRARLLVSRIALETSDVDTARAQLLLARSLSRSGTTADRVEICHARALLRIAEGNTQGAERSLRDGLRLIEAYGAALGAPDLRAAASGIGVELADRGLALAFESGRPESILAWTERQRAAALRLPPVRPPTDAKLRTLQAKLRQAARDGHTRREARFETEIRERARLVAGAQGDAIAIPDRREARRLLGERVLVEYVDLNGALHAIVLAAGMLSVHELDAEDASRELDWLRFALASLARGRLRSAQKDAARANVDAAAAALESALLTPLPLPAGAPVVVVPTGVLHALPWAALPSLRGRPIVVTPSLAVWAELARRPRSRRRKVALVAGPQLRHAAPEVRNLGTILPRATMLEGKMATAARVRGALDGAATAHLACHGQFRSDSPLFSSLQLADGPLNVYELQRLRVAPDVVVLSACDLALSTLHPGDELLGFASVLLGMGTRTIVASPVPVPDAAVKRLMAVFHRDLAAGAEPAAALAHAQSGALIPGFVCLGSG